MSRAAAARASKASFNFSIKNDVAWLRLSRPAQENRVDYATAQAICDSIDEIEHRDSTRAIVIAATGASFCLGTEAGGDWEVSADWVAAIGDSKTPTVAVVQGDAINEGFEMALACDLRIVARQARFRMAQVSEGRLPIHGGTQRLPRIVGRTRALDLLLTGRSVNGTEAEEMGLVTCAVPRQRLAATARRVVADLCKAGPVALRFAKEAVLKGGDMSLQQGIRLEEDLYALLQTTADHRAGVDAFLAKKSPQFKGR